MCVQPDLDETPHPLELSSINVIHNPPLEKDWLHSWTENKAKPTPSWDNGGRGPDPPLGNADGIDSILCNMNIILTILNTYFQGNFMIIRYSTTFDYINHSFHQYFKTP